MEVAILTVGDEVLAGDIANANAQWLATRLTDSGATVDQILTIPDDRERIAATLGEWTTALDAAIVTGGLGGTHDDVTADALANAFDRELTVDESVRRDVLETVANYRDLDPETVTADDLTSMSTPGRRCPRAVGRYSIPRGSVPAACSRTSTRSRACPRRCGRCSSASPRSSAATPFHG